MLIKTSITAALLLSAAAPAFAGQESRRVRYADLNLAAPAGIAALDRRIEQAIRRICGSAFPVDLMSHSQVRQCRESTRVDIAERRNAVLAAAASPATGGLAAGGRR